MTHWDAYRKGRISLKIARSLELLKHANPKKYRAEEKKRGI